MRKGKANANIISITYSITRSTHNTSNKKYKTKSNILTESHYKEWSNFSSKWFYDPKRYQDILGTHLSKHKAKWTYNMLFLQRQNGIIRKRSKNNPKDKKNG